MHERVLTGPLGVSTRLWQCLLLPLIEPSQHCLWWRRNLNSELTSLQLFRSCLIWRLAGLPGSRLACTQIHGALAFPAGRATGGPVFRTAGQTARTPDPSESRLLPQLPRPAALGHTRGPRLGRAHRAAIVCAVPGTLSFCIAT